MTAITRHHPACPAGAHVHTQASGAYVVWLDDVWLALVTDLATAERVAALINTHGLADVPDHIPGVLIWGPPCPDDQLIDWRLPANPTTQTQENER